MGNGSGSNADTANPKDLFGMVKVAVTKFPMIALMHAAHAMMDGARKYGPYNWRAKKVIASIYADAAIRHIALWHEGEQHAPDSGVHHLGHALACLGILIDAESTGNLVDDRPGAAAPGVLSREIAALHDKIKAKAESLKQVGSPPVQPSMRDIVDGKAWVPRVGDEVRILVDLHLILLRGKQGRVTHVHATDGIVFVNYGEFGRWFFPHELGLIRSAAEIGRARAEEVDNGGGV